MSCITPMKYLGAPAALRTSETFRLIHTRDLFRRM